MAYTKSEEPTYCTVEDVEETLSLPSHDDPQGIFRFSDMSNPTASRVKKMILGAEDVIDRRLHKSWRENYVVDKICTIRSYWHDSNGLRMEYYQQGGDFVQLRKDVLPWDPDKGDKLEIRTTDNQWRDITESLNTPAPLEKGGFPGVLFWIDYDMGKLYLRTRLFQVKSNAVRISYRYGLDEEPIPYDIQRLTALHVASQIINGGIYDIKIGMGGDIAGIKDQILRNWQMEMSEIYSANQRSGSVHSMLG